MISPYRKAPSDSTTPTRLSMRSGQVDFEVRLRLDAENELVAVITRESAESLGLAMGMELFAMVKSSSILLLTDGDNTENRFTTNGSEIDARTSLACTGVKNAGISLYTIRVIDGDATLLKNCATRPDMYYDVKKASELSPVVKAIASEISAGRLTQ